MRATYRQVPYKDTILIVRSMETSWETEVIATCDDPDHAHHIQTALRSMFDPAILDSEPQPEAQDHEGEIYANVAQGKLRIHHDPTVPRGVVELRDPDTGRVLVRLVDVK